MQHINRMLHKITEN